MTVEQQQGRESPFPSPMTAWYAVGILAVGWTLAYLDRQIIIILIESLRADLGMNDTQASMVQGLAFSLFFVLAGIPIGRLVDRANRRNILLFGILVWSLMTFACGLADNFWQLFAARMGVGIGEACLAPASVSLIADLIKPNRRGTAMGLMVAGTSFGNAGSIFLGGTILQILGPYGSIDLPFFGPAAPWQIVFFIVGAPGIILAFLLLTIREPERRERATGADSKSFFRFVGKHRLTFVLVYLAFSCNMVVGYSTSIWIPVEMMRIHDVSPGQVGIIAGGILLVFGTTGAALGGVFSDLLARRFGLQGRLGVMMVNFPIIAAVLVGWLFVDHVAYSIFAFAATAPAFGNMINGSSYPALNQMVPNEMRGQVVAFYLVVANLAGLGVAPTAVALITDYAFVDSDAVKYSVIAVAAPIAMLGFILALLARKRYLATATSGGAMTAREADAAATA